jgi:hypothetical protein
VRRERVGNQLRHVARHGVREGVDAAREGRSSVSFGTKGRLQKKGTHMAPTPRMALCMRVKQPAYAGLTEPSSSRRLGIVVSLTWRSKRAFMTRMLDRWLVRRMEDRAEAATSRTSMLSSFRHSVRTCGPGVGLALTLQLEKRRLETHLC